MAAELKIGIGADNSGLKQGLQDAEAQISAFVSKVGKIGQIGEQLSSIGQKMTVGLTLPILALGGSAVKAYGDLQSLEMGLKAVMGTSAKATDELEKLREVAKLPGLGLKEAVKGSVALQSAGFSANDARRSLMAFGNALATVGKGANELAFVNLALTQIQNKTSGFGQDLRQLTEQLPQLRGAMEAAFGTSNSEAISELGLSGKQVVSMLTTEFEKLPKVTGGIKNAFENLSDNTFIAMSRIGKSIDKAFDISGIIDKLTGYLDTAISAFESLSPAVQKSILVVTGLVAAAGPLLVVVGGIMQLVPTLTMALGALKFAMLAVTGPIGAVVLAVAGLAAVYLSLRDNTKKAADYQNEWTASLIKANSEARVQVSELDKLYKKTQDTTLSLKERKAAVDELQQLYPKYFNNISDEIILAGKAGGAYDSLRHAIVGASKARAASALLDKRSSELQISQEQRKIELAQQLKKVYDLQAAAKIDPKAKQTGIGDIFSAGYGLTVEQRLKIEKEKAGKLIKAYQNEYKDYVTYNKGLIDAIEKGAKDVANTTANTPNVIVPAIKGASSTINAAKNELKNSDPLFIAGSEGWYEQEISKLETLKTSLVMGTEAWYKIRTQISLYKSELEKFNEVVSELDADQIMANSAAEYVNKQSEQITAKIAGDIAAMQNGLLAAAVAFDDSVNEMFQTNLGNFFGAVGESLVNGGSIIRAAGSFVLGTLGELSTMLGKELMKTAVLAEVFGALLLAIKKAVSNPIALIAIAGAALVVGAALTASANNTANVGGGGGSVPSGGGNSSQSYSSTFSSGGAGGDARVVFEISGNNLLGVLDRARDKNTRLGG